MRQLGTIGWVVVVLGAVFGTLGSRVSFAQALTPSKVSPLDPTRSMTAHDLESARHTPLPEEYIWTANDTNADAKDLYARPKANERTEPHYFRRRFSVTTSNPDSIAVLRKCCSMVARVM